MQPVEGYKCFVVIFSPLEAPLWRNEESSFLKDMWRHLNENVRCSQAQRLYTIFFSFCPAARRLSTVRAARQGPTLNAAKQQKLAWQPSGEPHSRRLNLHLKVLLSRGCFRRWFI